MSSSRLCLVKAFVNFDDYPAMGGRPAKSSSKRTVASSKRAVSTETEADKPAKSNKRIEPNDNLGAIDRFAHEALLYKAIIDHPEMSLDIIDDHRTESAAPVGRRRP